MTGWGLLVRLASPQLREFAAAPREQAKRKPKDAGRWSMQGLCFDALLLTANTPFDRADCMV